MPKKVKARGKVFTFADNVTDEEIGKALDEYFLGKSSDASSAGEKKKEPTKGKIYQGVGSKDFSEGSQGGSLDFGKNAGLRKADSGSLDSEPNPIVSDLKRLQETKPVQKESPKPKQTSQDLRKVETSSPSDALVSPEKEFEAKTDIATTQQGEFYDIEKRKANAPRRVDTFDIGTDEYNDALVRDKIDYLWNVGEKDAANQLKETYEEILAEKGSGDLSRGQSERYRELITQAQVENNDYVEKELRVVDSRYKVKDFYKSNASTIQELNDLVAELDLGVSPERRVVLESQISALQGILGDSMGKTGITSDVLEAYSNIAGKFVDPRIVYDKATTESLKGVEGKNTIGAERQAEVERMNMSSNPIGSIGTGAHRAVDAFAETGLNFALSIAMQTPKVLGDMLGDTDYDFIDEMYDKASGLKKYVSEEMSWGDESKAPTYLMLSRVLGQATGSMATMYGGGALANMVKASQAATKVGTFGATMTMQMADNYESALAEGMSQQESALFGTWSSILSATVEQIVPEGVQPMKFTRLRDAIKEGVRGKELAEVALGSYAEYSMNVAKEMGEEVFEAAVGDINKQLAGYNPENLFSSQEYKEAILGAAMIGGSMTAMRSKKSRPFMVAEMLYDIAEVNESNLPRMSKEDMKTQKEMHEIRVSLESVPTWNDMSRDDRVIAFDAMVRKKDLEAAQKEVGESDGGQIAAEIEKVNAELNELLAPKAQEDTAIEEVETEVAAPEVAAETEAIEVKEETTPENEIDTQTTKIDEQSNTSELQGKPEEGDAGGGVLDASGELQEADQGGLEGERDTKSDQSKPLRTAADVEKVIRTRDERIGQILYDDSEQRGGNNQGDGSLGGVEGDASVLEGGDGSRPQAGEQVDGSNDSGGNGESEDAPISKTTKARRALESRVNDLLHDTKIYNVLRKKAKRMHNGHAAAQKKLEAIQKEAKKLGLDIKYVGKDGRSIAIAKKGVRILPRGTKGQAIEDEKVFKRAMKEDSDDLDMNILQRVYNGLAVTPEFFIKEFGHGKDSFEYKAAKRAGFIRKDGVTDFSKYATEQMENKDVDGNGITYDPYKVQEAVRIAMTNGSKANLKRVIIDAQKAMEAKFQKSEEQSKFESDVIDVVNAAKAEFDASGRSESERIDYVEKAITRLSRNKDLFEDSSVEQEALSSFRNDVAVEEREKNYVPYDTEDGEFSEGGEDAPFQESEDKGVEAINIFYDAYENGDLGDAIEAAMDFIDANPEARETFEKHLKENRSDLVAGKKKAKKVMSVKSREDFKKAVKELVPQISDEDIERLAVVGDAMVKYVLKLDPSLTVGDAWEQVQGHITNDLSKLSGGLNQGDAKRTDYSLPFVGDLKSAKSAAEKLLTEMGVDFRFSGQSESNGVSVYFDVNGVKVRFSDHSVTNIDRMNNEVHFHFGAKADNVEQSVLELRSRLGDKNVEYGKFRKVKAGGKDYIVNGYREVLNQGVKGTESQEIIEKAKANGTYMKAPNGQATNLNEAQWVQVRTKAFKDWFGDWENDPKNASKVVDENGEPMVVYHGTSNDSGFDVFDPSFSKANGMYFTSVKDVANSYTSSGNVFEVFLNIRNAEKKYFHGATFEGSNEGFYSAKYVNEYGASVFVAQEDGNPFFSNTSQIEERASELGIPANKLNFTAPDLGMTTQTIGSKFLSEEYGSHKDGVIVVDILDMGALGDSDNGYYFSDVYIVRGSNQIKSATGNNGEFSVNSNNILEQGVKGATSIEQGITAYTEAADVSTLIHEPAHNFLGLLDYMAANGNEKAAEHIKAVDDFAKSAEGKKFFDRSKAAGEKWAQGEFNENDPTFRQELFARSAEKYFMEGTKAGFSARMAEVFESFSKFLKELYKGVKNSPEHIELSDEMRSLFDALYGNDTTKKLEEVVTTTKLRNVIRAFVENSNLPQKDKDRLASDPKNIADKFEFDEMEKLIDDMIATYGIDAMRDEAMKEYGAIPLELKSIVYGKALMDLRSRIKTASGQELIALNEIYDEVYSVVASTAAAAGRYNAYIARIYSQDPEAVAKSIRKKMEKQHGYGNNMKRAEDAAKEIKEELDKDEDMSEILENGDVLDIIDGLKRNEKKEAAVRKKIEVLKKEQKIVATAVTLTIDGKVPTRQRAIAKNNASEAAKKFKAAMRGKTLNAGVNPSALAHAIEWGAWELIGKAMDFSTFMSKGVKVLGKDAESMMGEIYKESVKRLRAEGYDVSALTDDAGVDQLVEFFAEERRYEEARLKELKEQGIRDEFVKEFDKQNPSMKKLREYANEYKESSGSNELNDFTDKLEEKIKELKAAKDKAAKQKEIDKMKADADIKEKRKIGEMINKALLNAGFGQKDLDGNDTGKIDWKKVASDSKNVDETVSKIIEAVKNNVSPADLPLIEQKLRDAVTSLVMDKKQKAIDQFIRNRQTAAERKLRGKGTRKTRIDKLMDLHNMGGTTVKDVVDAIFEDFGVAKYTLEDEAFLKAWGEAKKKAMDAGRHIEAAELDEKLQNFMDARSSPIFSGDRFQSDYIQGLLASFVSWKQNASNLIDTLGFSAIWDTLSAQVKFVNGKPVLGDKYAIKMLRASMGKAIISAFDQLFLGGIDVISAQQFKTGNRESAPQVRFYERSRRETGQRGVRSNVDSVRQKLIRIIPRLNAATDALGGVVTQEMKTYLLIREMYIDNGVPFHEAAQKAWDAMNHDAFQDAFRQANNENPNDNIVRKKRRAYEILEENAYKKGGKEIFRRGQLAANIANLKSYELGLLSGVGWAIDSAVKKVYSFYKNYALTVDNEGAKYLLNALDFFVAKPLSMLTMFLKPTFNVIETSLKYAAFSNPAMTAYTATRLFAMVVANKGFNQKEYDFARGMKDLGRGVLGFVLAALMGFDDEDDDDTKLVGSGPKDPFKALSEGEQAALNSWNGVSIKNLGPMMMPAYIAAIDGNNKRYREAMDTFSIVNMMSLGSYTEGIARFYNNAKNKSIEESLMDVMIARSGQIINPLRRMTNDFQNVFNEKQKPITNRDLFLKSVGLVSMIGKPTIDAYGNTYYEGRTNTYTMDATLGLKHIYKNAERDKKINDYRAKYNVPISSLVDKKFVKFYDTQLSEVMSDELRYETAKYANPMRGLVYANYVDRYPNGQYGEPTEQEINDVVSTMSPETKGLYDNGGLVIYREYNASGDYGVKVDKVSDDVKGVASRDIGLFGLDYASQLRKSYIETKVAGEFSNLNSACNKYGRFKAAKEMKLDMALLYDWTSIEKEMKLLSEYGAKFE